jgi:uncharacterized membrane protein
MNTDPNQSASQSDTSKPSEREPKPSATRSTAEVGPNDVGSKLKEAQAKLLEAEAKLMEPGAKPGTSPAPMPQRATTREAEPRPRSEAPTDANANPNATNANAEVAARRPEPVGKETSDGVKEHTPSKHVTEQLSENVAGMLCYLFGWVSGLAFLLIDRRPSVRFHAAQSVAIFATLTILLLVFSGFFLGAIFPGMAGALLVLRRLVMLVWLVVAVVLVLKAAGGERFRVKMAADYGDRAARKS